jgi:deoxyhypusine monooxygenase
VQPLCSALKEDSQSANAPEAAFTLGQPGYRSAVPALVQTMQADVSPIVRHESTVALISIGDYDIIPELERTIEDRNEDVSNSALIASEYLTYVKQKRHDSSNIVKPRIRL